MTDIRRTVLWVVFTMSLVLLWDGWQKHNGHPSMFSPPAAKPVAAAGSAAQAGVPAAAGQAAGATAVPGAPLAAKS
ncbi:MAG: membrane protein insertase YidC, partial [Paucibacter sp.]|nr:membrane protein insertase YidC [Roseateles sp.]